MSMPPVSLCMIVKNEAQHLGRCLSSVKGLVSEIIIADTGSTDGSVEIARSFGATVIRVAWEHDFAKARNLTLRQASCPWILVLDADEAAGGWQPEALERLLNTPSAQGYFLPFIHYVGSAAGEEYFTDNVCRLFRNDPGIQFHGTIHEEAASSIWALPDGEIAYAALPVLHYGYMDEELLLKNKASRNLELIRAALQLDPQSYALRYALGTEFYQQGRYGQAADILFPLLDEAPSGRGYAADICLKTAFALQAAGRLQAARAVYTEGLTLFPGFTDLLESYARLLLEDGEVQEAYRQLLAALSSGDAAHKYPSSSGSGTSRTSLLAGQVCEQLYLFGEAKEHYVQAIRFMPDLSAAWEALVPLCLLSGDVDRLTALTLAAGTALSPGTLRLLVPAALNARAAGWLHALSSAAQLPAPARRVLQVLPDMLRQHEAPPAVAARLERLLPEPGPEQPFIHGYLWAWACRTGDTAAAQHWLGSLAGCRPGLPAVAQLLPGSSAAAPLLGAAMPAPPAAAPTSSAFAAPVAAIPAAAPVSTASTAPVTASSAAAPLSTASAAPVTSAPAEATRQPGTADRASGAGSRPSAADLAYAAQLLLQAGAWSSLLGLYRSAGTRLQWTRLPQPLLGG
ncbi:tetratricopeptide repeat-containing glycosyltransferase family 2 protein, partial [Paenibacillus camerounensis]|uniref:tetratricopeptide repeat-containing glycosyltransferase family 2 protein n=1 Tax=Paenibacillus camerounensis TaxID=1243663 RepID=UPI001427B6B7